MSTALRWSAALVVAVVIAGCTAGPAPTPTAPAAALAPTHAPPRPASHDRARGAHSDGMAGSTKTDSRAGSANSDSRFEANAGRGSGSAHPGSSGSINSGGRRRQAVDHRQLQRRLRAGQLRPGRAVRRARKGLLVRTRRQHRALADRRNKADGVAVLAQYTQSDNHLAEISYQAMVPIWTGDQTPRVGPQAVQNLLQVSGAPEAATANPDQFFDDSLIDSTSH